MKVKRLIGCAGLAIAATAATLTVAPGTAGAVGGEMCTWEPTGEIRVDGAEYHEDWGISLYPDGKYKRMTRIWRCDNGVFYVERIEYDEVNPDGTRKRGKEDHEPILT